MSNRNDDTIPEAMMVKIRQILSFGAFWLAIPQSALATYITMETENTVTMENNTVKVLVNVTNKGDEPAGNVRVGMEAGGKMQTGPLKDRLEINEKFSQELSQTLELKKPGKYPVVIMVDYTDANQYPFTAISIGYADYQERVVGRAVGEMEVAPVSTSGKLRVKVKNLESTENKIDVRLVLPREFTSPRSQQEAVVQPGAERAVVFDVKNIAALQGSRYQIYAVISYEDEKNHYASAIPGTIEVVEKKSFVKVYKIPLIATAIVLGVVVIYLNLRRKRGERPY